MLLVRCGSKPVISMATTNRYAKCTTVTWLQTSYTTSLYILYALTLDDVGVYIYSNIVYVTCN